MGHITNYFSLNTNQTKEYLHQLGRQQYIMLLDSLLLKVVNRQSKESFVHNSSSASLPRRQQMIS